MENDFNFVYGMKKKKRALVVCTQVQVNMVSEGEGGYVLEPVSIDGTGGSLKNSKFFFKLFDCQIISLSKYALLDDLKLLLIWLKVLKYLISEKIKGRSFIFFFNAVVKGLRTNGPKSGS